MPKQKYTLPDKIVPKFNLWDEKWIRVLNQGRVEEVSLFDALTKAHDYTSLQGETPSQDVAVLRFLLAVLHTIFSRVDIEGKDEPFDIPQDAVERWLSLWENGRIPEGPVREYMDAWKERFYLFHPERPFYQCPSATVGTTYSAAKLNGRISESENKIRLFSERQEKEKRQLAYPEAARWLLHLIAFDDTSVKKHDKTCESVSTGWCGRIGLVYLRGRSLFETLLLNLVLCDRNGELFEDCHPVWEAAVLKEEERTRISVPRDPASLFTLQSRRVILYDDGQSVIALSELGGDLFEEKNAFIEPMSLWRPDSQQVKEKMANPDMMPRRHDPSVQSWREFASLLPASGEMPGVIRWFGVIQDELGEEESLLLGDTVRVCTCHVEYDDKFFFIQNITSDSLDLHGRLLASKDAALRTRIESEIKNIEYAAYQAGVFASILTLFAGGDEQACKKADEAAKREFYGRMDQPFRQWLYRLDPAGSIEEEVQVWRKEARQIALTFGKSLVENCSASPFVQKTFQKRTTTIPEAYVHYKKCVLSYFGEGKGQNPSGVDSKATDSTNENKGGV